MKRCCCSGRFLLFLLIIGLIYSFFWQRNIDKQIAENIKARVAKIEARIASPSPVNSGEIPEVDATPLPEATIPADWKSYTDSDSGITFRYPNSWSSPIVSKIAKDSSNSAIPAQSQIFFEDATTFEYVYITSLDAYAGTYLAEHIKDLKEVYVNKAVGSFKALLFPADNGSVIYYTQPHYIEDNSGKFRGIYYYALIGQTNSQRDYPIKRLPDLVITLTNGQNNIWQLRVHKPIPNADSGNVQVNGCRGIEKGESCTTNKDLQTDFNQYYWLIAASISQ